MGAIDILVICHDVTTVLGRASETSAYLSRPPPVTLTPRSWSGNAIVITYTEFQGPR